MLCSPFCDTRVPKEVVQKVLRSKNGMREISGFVAIVDNDPASILLSCLPFFGYEGSPNFHIQSVGGEDKPDFPTPTRRRGLET